jgi:hypothetical protein
MNIYKQSDWKEIIRVEDKIIITDDVGDEIFSYVFNAYDKETTDSGNILYIPWDKNRHVIPKADKIKIFFNWLEGTQDDKFGTVIFYENTKNIADKCLVKFDNDLVRLLFNEPIYLEKLDENVVEE